MTPYSIFYVCFEAVRCLSSLLPFPYLHTDKETDRQTKTKSIFQLILKHAKKTIIGNICQTTVGLSITSFEGRDGKNKDEELRTQTC